MRDVPFILTVVDTFLMQGKTDAAFGDLKGFSLSDEDTCNK